MKKILILFLGILAVSCNDDFLDQVPDDRLTFEETFSKKASVEEYLANIYSRVPNEAAQRYTTHQYSGPWTGASDEAEYVWGFHMGNSLNIADWNAQTGNVSRLWSNFFQGIRAASTFINNSDSCGDCTNDEIRRFKAEAKILRAFFYYNLVRSWGPVMIIGNDPIPQDAPVSEIRLERNTMEENVNYIVTELEEAAAELDAIENIAFDGEFAGRMSRPFALAIKEKTLLLAASPLYNGNTDAADLVNSEGTHLIPQTTDVNKWKRAADAAKAFIDEYVPGTFKLHIETNPNGTIDPYLSTRNVMLEEWNDEIIYARPRGTWFYEYDVTPYHQGYSGARGAGGLGATQEMVDAYFMSNGRTIDDPASGYQIEGFSDFQAPYDFMQRPTYNMWVNREPRFYVGITYNNSLWLQRGNGNIVTETWYGGNSGQRVGGNDYSPTGYIVRKNITTLGYQSNRSIVMLRLAEIYLDYVEALNEYNPGHPDILLYLNKVRERAGIPGYGTNTLPAPAGQAEMREAIRRERRVELAFESVRYFDARRWKIAADVFDGPIHGMDIAAPAEEDFYEVVPVENRIFDSRHYFWPIPQDEVNTNPELEQNPGW